MATLTSKDGTRIAYTKVGHGPAIILVNGALGHRNLNGEKELSALLGKQFKVLYYDRRGRGESEETEPYSVQAEIDDVAALIREAGGKAFLHGTSAGAALALRAAAKLGSEKIIKLSLYEPPYDAYVKNGKNSFEEVAKEIKRFVHAGKPGDAVTFFFESIGTPAEVIQGMKKSTAWDATEKLGHTLVYDFEILGGGTIPFDVARSISMPAQVLNGDQSFDFMHSAADMLAKNIPNARRKTLKGQTHQASADALATVLSEFFASTSPILLSK